jgi:hypothetical protein
MGHGVLNNQDAVINGAMGDAYNLSSTAGAEMNSGTYSVMGSYNFNGSTVNTNKSFSITATSQKIVLNLKDLVMTGGTFTLQGTATTTFIINVIIFLEW